MTTRSGNLSLREKQRIEELLRCSRERKRLHIVEALAKKREVIEAPFNEKIEKLQRIPKPIVFLSSYGKHPNPQINSLKKT